MVTVIIKVLEEINPDATASSKADVLITQELRYSNVGDAIVMIQVLDSESF
jgi:hypothetical protein